MNDDIHDEGWPYRCAQHQQPTGLRCYRCDTPICLHCAHLINGTGYICDECRAKLLARYSRKPAFR